MPIGQPIGLRPRRQSELVLRLEAHAELKVGREGARGPVRRRKAALEQNNQRNVPQPDISLLDTFRGRPTSGIYDAT